MNVENRKMIYKILENIKITEKAKILQKFFENSIERVFNLIRFVDKKHIRYNSPETIKNLKNKEEWVVIDKILELSLNYCFFKI